MLDIHEHVCLGEGMRVMASDIVWVLGYTKYSQILIKNNRVHNKKIHYISSIPSHTLKSKVTDLRFLSTKVL